MLLSLELWMGVSSSRRFAARVILARRLGRLSPGLTELAGLAELLLKPWAGVLGLAGTWTSSSISKRMLVASNDMVFGLVPSLWFSWMDDR